MSSRKTPLWLGLAVSMALSLAGLAAANVGLAAQGPAQQAPPDLALPMPGGQKMLFRPVHLGQGGTPFAQRRFKMGDPDGGYKEYPTSVSLSGSFLGSFNHKPDWLYYLGKYEVTQAQYYSIMGLPPNAPAGLETSQMPVTGISWFEVQRFIDLYNRWLFAHALDQLPKNGPAIGFARLPLEEEWEFAARGGAMVSADVFDAKTPYNGPLTKHEWFAGPKSSHDKLKKVGLLRPNPLGLHDMLGNAAEMTASLYRIEYYQGKPGGFTARGGHYFTSEKRIRSSLRTEEPFYITLRGKAPQPNQKPTLGFRLALACLVFPDRKAARLHALAWEQHRAGKGANLPAALSVGPTGKKTQVRALDAMVSLRRLKGALGESGGISEKAKREMGLLEAHLADIQFIKRQAEEDTAFAWVKIAAERGYFIYRELLKLPTLDKLMAIAQKVGRKEMIEKLAQRRGEIEQNIDQALGTYSDSFRQLEKVSRASVTTGLARYRNFLLERTAESQANVLKVIQGHMETFLDSKRADHQKWRKDFAGIDG